MQHAAVHQSHPEIIKRLRRAEGHLRGVIGMIEQGRPCLDLAQQLHAVEAAIANAKAQALANINVVSAEAARDLVAKLAGIEVSQEQAAVAVRQVRATAHG